MSYSTCFVSLLMTISLFLYSSTLATSLRGHNTPIKNNQNADLVVDDALVGRNHFADFLRALYAPQAANMAADEMPNDIFPFTSGGEEREIQEEEYDRDQNSKDNEFPGDGVLLPILQKRNARYCGSFLADALQLACSSRTYFGKRSTAPGNSLSTATAATANTEFRSWPFINSDKAHSMLSNQHLFHRYTRGVHDECCVKGCSFNELKSYCTRPSSS